MNWAFVSAWSFLLFLGHSHAFLPTKLNYSDPDVQSYFCPDNMSGDTWDHKAITREALRREVRRFFLENPPGNGSFSIPADASLTEIFRAYYGPNASPTRFIKAVNSITWANAMTEASGQIRFSAAQHMDGEQIQEGHTLLQGRYLQMISTITADEEYAYARELFGTSLNSIQDFYSQTTWVELGNVDILKELGLPGMDIGEVAQGDEATCTNCADTAGECRNNVVEGSKLTSGYYEYDTHEGSPFVVAKPVGFNKCSHGGSMDTSINVEATGGINKETTSPCFSPHHYLHQQAVDLAIKASEYYISVVRDAIGDDHFLHLLDLYRGSALSIVIDITLSMSQEIAAVKEEVKLIVEKTNPELYVFVPYGDPTYGPVTKTSDSAVIIDALDNIVLDPGCCCLEEKFWHGLELAVTNTPDYSNIYCFTDAGANDAELMEGVISIAASKHCRVSIIYSYDNGRDNQQERNCPGYTVSGVNEYQRLAEVTGGQFIEIDKFDIDDIVGILEDGVDESKVRIRAREDVTGHQEVSYPIDDSVIDFDIVISGAISAGTLTDSKAHYYDLTDEAALQGKANVEIVSFTSTLKFIRFNEPTVGGWDLELEGEGNYTVTIGGTSTLGFLDEFAELLLDPPRPSYRIIVGRPLTHNELYVEITLVGYLESGVSSVEAMEFVNGKGEVLSHVDYKEEVDDHFYIRADILPSSPFYIQVDGHLNTGASFSRIAPTMILPADCFVELLVEPSSLSAKPGETTKAYFRVVNYGPDADFDYTASDEEKFIITWFPKSASMTSMASQNITVTFTVPSSAKPGTVSTVTFTATSKQNPSNSNTAITHFIVLEKDLDMEPPSCVSSSNPTCSGTGNCEDETWSVEATLSDTISGLSEVYPRPEGDFTLTGFTEGTTSPVTATYTASCCITAVDIIGVDGKGNVGRCEFVVENSGGVTDIEPPTCVSSSKPTCSGTGNCEDETWSVEATLSDTISGLSEVYPQPEGDFSLTGFTEGTTSPVTATYTASCCVTAADIIGVDGKGNVGRCEFEVENSGGGTGPVIEFVAESVGETWVYLRWVVSEVREDFLKYSILTNNDFSEDSRCSELTCHLNVTYLDPCTLQNFELTPHYRSDDGINTEGTKAFTDATTLGTVPEAPTNPSISYTTETSTTITWDGPLKDACVDAYEVCYTMVTTTDTKCFMSATTDYTMENLEACTLYSVKITTVSLSGHRSDPLDVLTKTDDAAPGAPENVRVDNQTSHWVMLTWNDPKDHANCVDRWMVSYAEIHDDMWETKKYSLVEGDHSPHSDGEPDNTATVSDLLACTNYTFWVSAVSENGLPGSTTTTFAAMDETDPTPLESIEATPQGTSSVSAVWSPALVEECVDHYHVCIQNTWLVNETCFDTHDTQNIFTGLDPCITYEVTVTSVSPSGHFAIGEFLYDLATTADMATSPPTNLKVLNIDAHSATASFDPPLVYPQCVDEYDTRIVLLDDIARNRDRNSRHIPAKPNMEEILNGLEACADYEVWLSAVTPSGYKSSEISHSFTTGEDIPSAPQALNHSQSTENSVTLFWFTPEMHQLCVNSYNVAWTSGADSGNSDYDFPSRPMEMKVTVSGLVHCKEYTFSVKAKTPSGAESPPITHKASTLC